MKAGIFGFIFAMWVLILAGGGIMVTVLGPVSVSGFGDLDWLISSGIKAVIAVVLVILWILILSRLKNWIFKKEINS